MLKSVKIENFRCFPSFELQPLGRINLLVGANNSGKTSILEAIQLLCSRANLEPLQEMMTNRGEYFWIDKTRGTRELDISHLFYNHQLLPGSQFLITGKNNRVQESLSVSIEEEPTKQLAIFGETEEELVVMWTSQEDVLTFPLSPNDCLVIESLRHPRRKVRKIPIRTQFVTSSSLRTLKMAALFNQVALTPEEDLVREALQTIEPKIEQIASLPDLGFYVRLSDNLRRLPIGSMGDGIWRILGLALATVGAQDGVLLVDEIDTGLHFTTMTDMWKLIWETAKRLDIQVFATTHNSDCWQSLASIASQTDAAEEGVKIHRIERDKTASVVFTERQIAIAAERDIEVR